MPHHLNDMPLNAGDRVGAYDVIGQIGAGGMGIVYRAHDTQLDRDVALKVLPEAFTADPDRLARFEREAKVLASLNHPNIGSIYGLEEAEGGKFRALVLELVEGPTLADRITKGPIPLDEALPIAKQIAEALEAAHEQGVIHRDLKPANIKVKADGTVKVLDFGLAKAFQPDAGDPNLSQSPTISLSAAATQLGMVIGTAAYMAPEQAKGLTVDKRADIWAYGAVLFEMLTGRKLFDAGDVSEMLASVLVKDPDISSIGSHVPAHVRSVVRRCLVKDPKQRLRDIGDVRLAMKGTVETTVAAPSDMATAPPLRVWQRPIPATLAVLAALGLGALAVWSLTPAPVLDLARFVITAPPSEPVRLDTNTLDLTISPDGRRVVYRTGTPPQLYVRALDQLAGTPLAGTEGAQAPFFSADGTWVGFQSGLLGPLKKVSVLGGPSVTLCALGSPLRGASWGADDTIIFATASRGGLRRVAAAGGEPEALTTPEAGTGGFHHFPEILPGGKALLFTMLTGPGSEGRIALLNLETREEVPLISLGSQPRYAATGHIVYGAEGTLRAVPFDLARLTVTGDPVPVLEDVLTKASGAVDFGLAEDGSLVYVTGAAGAAGGRSLVWVDREGREEAVPAPPRAYVYPRIAPDGTRVAVDIRDQEQDIWIWDFAGEVLTRLTFGPSPDLYSVWTPDGLRVAFSSQREGAGPFNLFWKAADGTGTVERLTDSPNDQFSYAFSPDGEQLLFREIVPDTGQDLRVLSLDDARTVTPLVATPFDDRNAELSPDGHWLAYESNASGQFEIYVRPFPDVEAGRWQVSRAGGIQPAWGPDGQELFYRDPARRLVAVPVRGAGATFTPGNPEVLFEAQGYFTRPGGRTYDVSPDGERFLLIKTGTTDDTGARNDIILVENWHQELERLVPLN